MFLPLAYTGAISRGDHAVYVYIYIHVGVCVRTRRADLARTRFLASVFHFRPLRPFPVRAIHGKRISPGNGWLFLSRQFLLGIFRPYDLIRRHHSPPNQQVTVDGDLIHKPPPEISFPLIGDQLVGTRD
jgi:hypothetical protein